MRKKLGKVMDEDLFVDEDRYSGEFGDFLVGDERFNVDLRGGG